MQKVMCIATGKVFTVHQINDKPVQAPGDQLRKEIPEYTYEKVETDLAKLRYTIFYCTKNNVNVPIDLAIQYLITVLHKIKNPLSEQWKSYGHVIGESGTDVTPWSLIKLTPVEAVAENELREPADGVDDKDDLWICLWLLGGYRIDRATESQYRLDIITQFDRRIKENGGPSSVMLAGVSKTRALLYNKTFKAMVAAIDMYFFRFKDDPWAILRFATTGSRFKDCGALMSLCSCSRLCGYSQHNEFLPWIFSTYVAKEVKNMFESDEEYNDSYSYFPYHMDLGLCDRCAFSSNANPSLHFYTNVIGCILGDRRSQNARMITVNDRTNVMAIAKLVGYVHSMSQAELLKNQQEVMAEGMEASEKMPVNRDPLEWFQFYERIGRKPTKAMTDKYEKVKSLLSNSRPGTIGEFLAKNM